MVSLERIAVQAEPADVVLADAQDESFLPGILERGGDGAVKVRRFAHDALAVVLLGGARHERRIHHQQVALGVELEELDGPAHHVGKRRLLVAALHLAGEGEVAIGEDAGERAGEEAGGVFQLGLGAHQRVVFAAQLQPEIAAVLALAALALGGEVVHAAAHGDVHEVALGKLLGDGLRVLEVGGVGVKGGGGGIGEIAGGDDARGAAPVPREGEDGGQRFAARFHRNGAVVPLHPRGNSGGGGSRVRYGVVIGAVAEQRKVRERLDRQPLVRAALIEPGGREGVGGEAVGDEKDDPERLLHHPVHVKQKSEPDKGQQKGKGKKLVA